MRLFATIVKSTLLYGCECWTITKPHEKKLKVIYLKCLWRILKLFYPTLVRNEMILNRAGESDIVDEARKRKWRWAGHITGREDGHFARQAINFRMKKTRRVGRPRETWVRIAKREFENATSVDFERVTEHVQDTTLETILAPCEPQ